MSFGLPIVTLWSSVQGVDDIIGVYGDPERSIEVIIEGNNYRLYGTILGW